MFCSEEAVYRAELSFLAQLVIVLFSKVRAARRSFECSMKLVLREAQTMSAPARTMVALARRA